MELVRNWFKSISDNPQLTLLVLLLVFATVAVLLTADILGPFLAAVVIAYLLQVAVDKLEGWGVRRWLSLAMVFVAFLVGTFVLVVGVIPPLIGQLTELAKQMPQLATQAQDLLKHLPENYPALVSESQVQQIVDQLRGEALGFSQRVLGSLGGTVVGVMTWLVYLIIVPLMVFFLIKDKEKIVTWITSFLPRERDLAGRVWQEVHHQLQNYVGGKVLEIFIVAVVTFIVFWFIDLDFALLLAVITGFSVLIPYIGAAVTTLPVAIIALLQWGVSTEATTALVAYAIIQALDGNLLVPFLFSEAVDLHPVAIIVAILFFGGVWGFWGVFFAIPLAVVVQAVIRSWPQRGEASLMQGNT